MPTDSNGRRTPAPYPPAMQAILDAERRERHKFMARAWEEGFNAGKAHAFPKPANPYKEA